MLMLLIIALVQPRPRARPLGKPRQATGKGTKFTRGAERGQRMLPNGIALQMGPQDSDTRLHINQKATSLYGFFSPTAPVSLHSSQYGAQVGTNLEPAMKIQPWDELSHLLILGLSSHACRCDMIQSTKNRDLSRHLTFRLPPPPLASHSPFLFHLPLGMNISAAMTTNQQIDQRHVLQFSWRPPVTAQK